MNELLPPDLSLNACGGKETIVGITYGNQASCSSKRHIPLAILRSAKKQLGEDSPTYGFMLDGRIRWNLLQPWLIEHYKELDEEYRSKQGNTSLEEKMRQLEYRELLAETIHKENRNRKESGKYIEKKKTFNTFARIVGKIMADISDYLEFEQPMRIENKTPLEIKEINVKWRNRVFGEYFKQEEIWKQDKNEENKEDDSNES